jgi:sporulation protein YunB
MSNQLDKTLKDFAETTGTNYICEIINDSVLCAVEKHSAEYDSICKIHYDSAGKITAITVNSQSVNKLKGETIAHVIKAFKDKDKKAFSVPLGTLVGSRIFSAKGPDIDIEIIPLGAINSQLTQKFTSVGINQTLHSLYLNIHVSVKIASPFSYESINVSNEVCIAETVIVGDIPFAYLD